MKHTDLRLENPPLGFRAEEVPLVDVTAVMADLADYRMPHPFDPTAIVDVFDVPGEPVVLRTQELDVAGPRTLPTLRAEIAEANSHFTVLYDGLQIGIPPHRHIEAVFPTHKEEGRLVTLANRLVGYRPLDMNRSKRDLQSGIMVLDGLTKYMVHRLQDPAPNARFLSDIFGIEQFSVNEYGTNPILHDSDMILDEVEAGESDIFRRAVGELHTFAAAATQAAQGNTIFAAFMTEIQGQLDELPPPMYDRGN